MAYPFMVPSRKKTISGAPVLNAYPAFPYVERAVPGASGDWALGGSAASFTPIGGAATLTAQAATHVFGDNYVEMKAYQQGLVTNISETSEVTVWVAWRYIRAGAKTSIVTGNFPNGLASGFGITTSTDGGITVTCFRAPGTAIVVNLSGGARVPAGLSDGDIIFGAVSLARIIENGSEVGTRIRVKLSTFAAAETVTTATRVLSTNKLALGDAFFSSASYTPVDNRVYSFGSLPMETTLDHLDELCERISRRLTERGETVR